MVSIHLKLHYITYFILLVLASSHNNNIFRKSLFVYIISFLNKIKQIYPVFLRIYFRTYIAVLRCDALSVPTPKLGVLFPIT